MDRARFEALAEAFGGDVTRWPEAERGAALALLADQPALAREVLAAATRLDGMLDALPAPAAGAALRGRVLAAAPMARPARSWRRWLTGAGVGFGLATACAAGLVAGVSAAQPSPDDRRADAVLTEAAAFEGVADIDAGGDRSL